MSLWSRVKNAGRVLMGKPLTHPENTEDTESPTHKVEPQKENPKRDMVSSRVVHLPPSSVAPPTPTSPPPVHPLTQKRVPAPFMEYRDKHRKHQKEAIAACDGQVIGQISIPTGTGKTRIQVHLHLQDMIDKFIQGSCGVYVITAHRLALCKQLLDELIDQVVACHLPFDALFVGSDRVDENDLYERYMAEDISKKTTYVTASTKTSDIEKAAKDALTNNRNLLVVSTYHSLDRLDCLSHISMITYDEAHTIASSRHSDDNFEGHVRKLQDKGGIARQFFFTATRKVSGVRNGMNDEGVYGRVLYEVSPRSMIQAGEIVPPQIHKVNTEVEGDYKNGTMLTKAIHDSFSRHRLAIRGVSPLSVGKLGAKLLVTLEGSDAIDMLRGDMGFKSWCLMNKIQLFMFSSKHGNFMLGGDRQFRKVPRNEAIGGMQALSLKDDAIFLHIDILTEGIDLPAITGVMPFRELNLIKLLQTIGRGARLIPEDRKALYSGKVLPMEYDKMIKPCCWVIFPVLDTSSQDDSEKMEAIITKVREAYEVPTMEYSREDEFLCIPDPELDEITPRDTSKTRDPVTDLLHTLENLLLDNASNGITRQELTEQLKAVADPSLLL